MTAPGTAVRVAHVAWMGGVGGGELFALDLVRRLERSGGGQTLLCLGPRGELAAEAAEIGVPMRRFEKRSRLGPATLLELATALRRARPEVVQLHGEAGVLWGLPAARLAGAPAVCALVYQLSIPRRDKRLVLGLLLRRADRVLCGSEAVRRFVIDGLGVTPRRARVAYCGIDVARFRRVAADRRGPEPEGPPLLVAVGRLVPEKGHATLLAACRLLRDRGVAIRLEIAGEGPQRQALEAEIARLGLGDAARLCGTVRPTEALYRRAGVFVMPSLAEAQGLAVLEAFAAGVPVVATRAGGLGEMVADGETGLLVPPGDAGALAAAVARVLENRELRAALVRNAAAAVEAFDLGPVAARFALEYEELTREVEG